MQQLRGLVGPAWWVVVLRPGEAAVDRRQAIVESLRKAVDLARTPSPAEDTITGFAAYEAWIRGLADPPESPNLHANAYLYSILLTSRTAAAEYLRKVAGELAGGAEQYLRQAAERYLSVSQRLLAGRDCVKHPWEESWTPENREKQARILAGNLRDEREAIADIERALAALAGPA